MAALKLGTLGLLASLSTAMSLLTPKECPADSPLSCHNSSAVEDTCCFNTPGGLLLLTEFWDTDPATGPDDSWTIHGLWPDNCDGTYESNCDSSREYSNITDILQSFDQGELVDFMSQYWKDYQGDDESFWSHEWNKHGTCISTLETDCYTDYKPQEEVKDFFAKTVEIFKGLDTYGTLSNAGITPDSSKTYALSDLQSALSEKHGADVTINCRDGEVNEVWYFYNVKGSVQTGEFQPAKPGGEPSTCPDDGIKYLPK